MKGRLLKCNECEFRKPKTDEHFGQVNGEFRLVCRLCINKQNREYYQKNKEKFKEYQRKRQANLTEEDREKARQRSQEWRDNLTPEERERYNEQAKYYAEARTPAQKERYKATAAAKRKEK